MSNYYRHTGSHDRSQIPCERLVMVTRLLQALMLLMVIVAYLLTAWYSALYCPTNHSDVNENIIENQIKHFMRAFELMLMQHFYRQCSWVRKQSLMASIKKRRIPSAFYRLGLLYLFLNFLNIKHIASLYNRSIVYLAGMKINNRLSALHSLFKYIDDSIFYPAPVPRQVHKNGPF